jgi:sedoheptulokinase
LKVIGLDVGTTTISGVLIDTEEMTLLCSRTIPNNANLPAGYPWENIQNPEMIWELSRQVIDYFSARCTKIDGIGITGQMHGILYLDASGNAVSNLATWQDERGNQIFQGNSTYCDYLSSMTGYPMATGYGLTTHFFNMHNHLIPENAIAFSSIADYIAMRLCRIAGPVVHPTNAASFGFYDLGTNTFDISALKAVEIPASFLPFVVSEEKIIGYTRENIPVCIPIGDNQASFIGSVNTHSNLLINVGTSSQISLRGDRKVEPRSLEYRPFISGSYLLVGAGLCGGISYQLIRDLLKEILGIYKVTRTDELYAIMNEAAKKVYGEEDNLAIDTRFRGTRKDPKIRGAIRNIGVSNFTVGHLALGILRGICNEMKSFYDEVPDEWKESGCLIGSGNAIRKNPLLRKILSDTFKKEVLIPKYEEEASIGAALLAASIIDRRKSLPEIQNLIRYDRDRASS